ncbi:carboxymuconolactone decarboxylase family protein [Bradyrhizobium sp. 2]|nr:carboxymuconolactone decarboxylase family protein [Bradyrhizobium sp. 2]
MATVKLLSDDELSAEARAVFDDIRKVRKSDFVNNFWRALAHDPKTLRRTWESIKEVMAPGALDPKIKEMLYVAVSIAHGCSYCIHSHTAGARAKGMTEAEYGEMLAIVGMAAETNRLVTALGVPVDEAFLVDAADSAAEIAVSPENDDLPRGIGGFMPPRNWLVIPRKRVRGREMTYCCGILVRDGLVMIADTRTNAGLDNVSTFRKLHIFSKPGDRIMAIASAGNLAISQSVLSTLTEGLEDPTTGEIETLMNAPTMFQAAQRIGRAIRAVHATEGPALRSEDVSFDVSFLFGGQIKGARMRLFMVYTAGNFIECTTDTPYLQIGEHKYGKPVLDRAMHYDVELYEALKTGLISMDSTMRSNLGVGLPIDVLVVRSDACDADLNHRIEAGEPYFHDLRSRWSAALRAAHQNIPRPPYKNEKEPKT